MDASNPNRTPDDVENQRRAAALDAQWATSRAEGHDRAENPFAVLMTGLDDAALYERLSDFVRVLQVLWRHRGTVGSVNFNLVDATRALHTEAMRRNIPLHRLPILPWDEREEPSGEPG